MALTVPSILGKVPPGAQTVIVRPVGIRRPLIKLSIIMAVFNEEQTVAHAIKEVLSVDYPCEIELIIVDDGSTDGTRSIVAEITDKCVITVKHTGNKGKGAALRSGLALATGTHMLPFDADLEYVADDILNLLQPILRGRCDVVYGVRLFGYNTVYPSYWHAVGNRILTRLSGIIYGAWLTDLHTCLKLIPIDMIRNLKLRESGFGFDTEITAALLRRGVRPFEVPISYFGRLPSEGKKIGWRDAITCLRILMQVRISPISYKWADTELSSDCAVSVSLGPRTVQSADAEGYAVGAAAD